MASTDFQNGFINGFVAGSTSINVNTISKVNTEEAWTEENPVLPAGEIVAVTLEDGSTKLKVGDGEMGVSQGSHSQSMGYKCLALGDYSHSVGYATKAAGESTFAACDCAEANGDYSVAVGSCTVADGISSFSAGDLTKATASGSTALGYITTSSNIGSQSTGKYNKAMTAGGAYNTQVGDAFVIGNGTSNTVLSNAFRVDYTGGIYGTKAFNSSGADYAEFVYPWYDDNSENEDRIGYFVTFKDGKLYKATSKDIILGITSGNPSIVGNSEEDYYWKYERDEFNRIVFEDVEEETFKLDENGKRIKNDNGDYILEKTGNIIKNGRMKLSESYDPTLQDSYVERKDRKEWDYVGMLGILPTRDDGTCIPGQYCKCNDDGIATLATAEDVATNRFTFIVLERVSDNVVKIILK